MQLEYVIVKGKERGPYWYAYNRWGGHLTKAYIGKKYDIRKASRLLNLDWLGEGLVSRARASAAAGEFGKTKSGREARGRNGRRKR